MLMFPCAFASVSVTYCHHSSSTGLPTGKAKGYFLCHKAHTIIDSLSLYDDVKKPATDTQNSIGKPSSSLPDGSKENNQ